MMAPLGYSVRKAAQVIAFLVIEQGGEANLIKTVKLVYLSDRRFLELYDIPILNDDFFCLENGPINSTTYDYIKGQGKDQSEWDKYIKIRHRNVISLAKAADRLRLDELSDAEESILREVVAKFRKYRPFQLVDYVHRHCSEWNHPGTSSSYLSYQDVFKALNKDKIPQRVKHFQEMRRLSDYALKR
jgi:uncharacterized phage-associated protein